MPTGRIIPTRVGTSHYANKYTAKHGDHPHACGDKNHTSFAIALHSGSSPRVWGQDSSSLSVYKSSRIIPTRVGTRGYSGSACVVVWDHPHACGDKTIRYCSSFKVKGSSPRVWGQVNTICYKTCLVRIIPTRVGTRRLLLSAYHSFRDHPHACGDKLICTFSMSRLIGSSPRVWGQDTS